MLLRAGIGLDTTRQRRRCNQVEKYDQTCSFLKNKDQLRDRRMELRPWTQAEAVRLEPMTFQILSLRQCRCS